VRTTKGLLKSGNKKSDEVDEGSDIEKAKEIVEELKRIYGEIEAVAS
jgi:hypothetical protein